MKKIPPIHPGEILKKEFLTPLGISQYKIAKDISVPPIRISEIINGKRSVTADTAIRLSMYFGTTPEFWLNLQTHYDLEIQSDKLKNKLNIKIFIISAKTMNQNIVSKA
jgi:antitoxin HigA-1